ncbi:MAG: pentapeptide repeat-containing protein [Deltaproteobacteria bacterium]|nr:pentapeptide repeat-containing protein [Deltaproteobacteria bacterium]
MPATPSAEESAAPVTSADQLKKQHVAGVRNFARARLANADLFGSDLRSAELTDADLTGVNLEHADLRDANFQGATLLRAKLRDANLENADLSCAVGLLPAQLAGANLAGARLPEKFGDFDGLRVVEEESKNARALFFSTLLSCVYGWLTIASTSDVLLLTNTSSSPLPIIGASIPIVSFYIVGPLILLLLYVYLHLHLQRLWERLADLPAVFPDGRSLGKCAYPWLLTGLVYSYNPYLKICRPPLSRLQSAVSLLIAWWLVPLTVALFWLRYLRRHDWLGTTLHIVVLVAAVGAGVMLYRLAVSTLRGQRSNPAPLTNLFGQKATYSRALWVALLAAAIYILSLGAIEGVPPEYEVAAGEPSLIQADVTATDLRRWVPQLLQAFGNKSFADLREVDVSTRLPNWKGQEEDEIDRVKRGRLRGANLRFADATRAFLVGADLSRTNLQGSYLFQANLRGVDFTGANLSGANLKGARLENANLENSNLNKTNLSATSLTTAKGLSLKQLATAVTDKSTQLPENPAAGRNQ